MHYYEWHYKSDQISNKSDINHFAEWCRTTIRRLTPLVFSSFLIQTIYSPAECCQNSLPVSISGWGPLRESRIYFLNFSPKIRSDFQFYFSSKTDRLKVSNFHVAEPNYRLTSKFWPFIIPFIGDVMSTVFLLNSCIVWIWVVAGSRMCSLVQSSDEGYWEDS